GSSLCPTTEYCFHRMFFRPDLSFTRVAWVILEEEEMKVFIADDSKVIVERLADLLRDIPGVELTGQAGDAPEAMRCIEEKIPAILGELIKNFAKSAPAARQT